MQPQRGECLRLMSASHAWCGFGRTSPIRSLCLGVFVFMFRIPGRTALLTFPPAAL